jgi:hypothetical protein
MDKVTLAVLLAMGGVGIAHAQTLPSLNQNPQLPLNTHNTLVYCTQFGQPFACNSNDFAGGSGGGSVTSVTAGLGLAGGTITSAGTISLQNTSMTFGGQVVNLGGAANVQGTSGSIQLSVSGAAGDCAKFDANNNIEDAGSPCATGSGTVTSVSAGLGLTGGPITGSGTLSMISNSFVVGTQTISLAGIAGVRGSSALIQLGSGTPTSGHCAQFDSNLNIVDAGGACTTGGGGGTVSSGTANDLAYYASTGTAVTGLASANSGVLVTNASGVPSIGTTLPNINLGTPSAVVLSNGTSLPISTGISGLGTGVATALADTPNATGGVVLFNGALGTPTQGILTHATGLPIGTGVSGLGTGIATALGNATVGTGDIVLAASPSITINTVACTVGGSCTITATAAGITVGTTTVSSGTTGYLLYNNAGTLGNESIASLLASPPAIGGTTPAAGSFTTLSSSGAATLSSLGVTNAITPSQTAGIVGTTTNNSANSGSVGEYVSSTVLVGSAVTLPNSTVENVTSVSLTAGDWDCSGNTWFATNGSGSGVAGPSFAGWINTTSATEPTAPGAGGFQQLYLPTPPTSVVIFAVSTNMIGMPTGTIRESLSTTTTVYLGAASGYTQAGAGTTSVLGFGFLGCRRVR